MTVGELKLWLNDELTPFTWQRILMRLLPAFKEEGMFFHTIKDDQVLSQNLINLIDKTLIELYKTSLPKSL